MKLNRFMVFLLVIFLLGILSYFQHDFTGQVTKSPITEYPLETATLLRVIDGDTIVVTGPTIGNQTHIRMLGINTPEKNRPFSNESKKFLSQFLNQSIILERDFEDTDRYDRKLRYLFYNDSLINLQILENGFANTYYLNGLKYEQQLINAESQAKTQGIGIWTPSQEECSINKCIYLKEINAKEEFFTIGNNCLYTCNLVKWFVKDAGRNVFYLSPLKPLEEKTIYSKNNTNVWNDEGDRFFMFDKKGLLVLFSEY